MKKLIALLLALVLCAGLAPAAVAEETVYTLPEFDITGDKVTILCWGGSTKALVHTEGGQYYRVNQLLKEHYGIEIEVIRTTYEQLPSKAASLIISDNAPDLIFYKDEDFPSFIVQNVAQEVSPWIDFSDPFWADLQPTADMWKYKDGYYLIPSNKVYNDSYIYYWKDMFEDAGLETPLELYRNGEWTLSKMQEMMYELTLDEDRDGIMDVYGLCMHSNMGYYITGEDFVNYDPVTGLFENNLRNPAHNAYFDFQYNTSSAVDGSRLMAFNAGPDFIGRKAAMLWSAAWIRTTFSEYIKSGQVEFAPSPILDGAESCCVKGRTDVYWMGKGCKNPGGAAAVLACMRYMNVDPELQAKYEKEDQEIYGWTDEQKALMKEMDESPYFTKLIFRHAGVGNWGNAAEGQWNLWSDVGLFEVPWLSTVEKFYPVLQAEIDVANGMVTQGE